ncbi:serine/threonine-protein kinase [Chondromyces crocatus]|uniref:Protein kinase domain-containing protein n=1 Tax=Chondromyces crocatus TaxID=52 RepID=A0A0K1ETP6_CHOCO|nr:serine/threonine-protein kinase [Chondromyces crocatus]AKT44159.1 uncharacterized protein CMC5_083990 [Chondromyces crocatus]
MSAAACRMSPTGTLRPGQRLPGTRLVVVKPLGQGGMGEVYEVEHVRLGRRFAVKVLHQELRDREDLAARIADEARLLGRIRHPGVVQAFDVGTTSDGRPYFVMELIAGQNLRALLGSRGALAPAEALGLLEQALGALGAVHGQGFVHRDVKLENLIVDARGRLTLIDFGVARRAAGGGPSHTLAGAIVGTPRTMAPEQCSPGAVDARADLYAAGLALYELVTGRGPFDDLRGNSQALRFAHCDRPVPSPSCFTRAGLPDTVEAIILRALEKEPGRRFQTVEEMAAAVAVAQAALEFSPGSRRRLGEVGAGVLGAAALHTGGLGASEGSADDVDAAEVYETAQATAQTEDTDATLPDLPAHPSGRALSRTHAPDPASRVARRLAPSAMSGRRLMTPERRRRGRSSPARALPRRHRAARPIAQKSPWLASPSPALTLGVCAIFLASMALALTLSAPREVDRQRETDGCKVAGRGPFFSPIPRGDPEES